MSIILKYLSKQIVQTMLAVTVVLMLVFMSGRFVRYLEQAAVGGISADILFPLMAYRLPEFLQMILPAAFLLAILLTYGRMFLESEMTALIACGMSERRLVGLTLMLALLAALLVGSMSTWLAPLGFTNARQLLLEQSRETNFGLLKSGTFQSFRAGKWVVYAGNIDSDRNTLQDVFISEASNNTEIYARSGSMEIDQESGDKFLVLSDGSRTDGVAGSKGYRVQTFKRYGIRLDNLQEQQRIQSYDLISQSTLSLFKNPQREAQAEFYWRLSLPMTVPILCLFAVPLSRVNQRQGRYMKMFPAFLMYLVYLGLLITARKSMEADEHGSVWPLLSVHLVFLFLGLVVLFRHRWLEWLGQLFGSVVPVKARRHANELHSSVGPDGR